MIKIFIRLFRNLYGNRLGGIKSINQLYLNQNILLEIVHHLGNVIKHKGGVERRSLSLIISSVSKQTSLEMGIVINVALSVATFLEAGMNILLANNSAIINYINIYTQNN